MMDFGGKLKTAFYNYKFPLIVTALSYFGIIHPALAQVPASARAAASSFVSQTTASGNNPPSAHRQHYRAPTADQTTAAEDLAKTPNENEVVPGTVPGAPVSPYYLPGVSYTNGWIAGSVGGWHSNTVASNGVSLVASGGFTMPITYRFGIQSDAYDGAFSDENLFMINGYIFWRNPCIATAAFHYRYANIDHVYANLYGLHGEGYFYNFTGVLEGGSIHTNTRGGNGYFEAIVAWYANPNWRFDIGYLNVAGRQSGQLGSEYQLGFFPSIPGIAAYGAVGGGDHNLYYGYLGLKVYFGCDKSLLQRHREDTLDPSYDLLSARHIESLGFF